MSKKNPFFGKSVKIRELYLQICAVAIHVLSSQENFQLSNDLSKLFRVTLLSGVGY